MADDRRGDRLRPLAPEELVCDRTLPGHLRDQSGRILLRSGQRLTGQQLRRLAERGVWNVYVGSDWPCAQRAGESGAPIATAEEAMRALLRQRSLRSDQNRHRRHRRHRWVVELTLTLEERTRVGIRRRDLHVWTRDLSSGGFAFDCKHFVHPGSIVYVRLENLPDRPAMKGLVRNCAHLGDRRHRVGVEFTKLEPGESIP